MNAVEVCNLALGRIGEGASRPIVSLTESTDSARACNRVFAPALQALLREYRWPFAQSSVQLATVAQTVPGWDYVYAYPEGVLTLHGLAGEDIDPGRQPVWRHPFRVLAATSGESLVIATDLEDAWAHYTLDITNPHFGDALFQDALAWRVAKEVALSLKADPRMAQLAAQQYADALSLAMVAAYNERGADALADPEDVRAYGAAVRQSWPETVA